MGTLDEQHTTQHTNTGTSSRASDSYLRKPPWLKIAPKTNENFKFIKSLVRENRLATVCEEAKCPNIHECWSVHKTGTFMILGDTCTRRCRFCSVKTGLPKTLDLREPGRVADSVAALKLSHVVITMVNRDELADGGAAIVAATVRAIRERAASCSVELLTSDFMGKPESIHAVLDSEPAVMSHNVETVRRLTPFVRSRSDYERSLFVLRESKAYAPHIPVKSSIMLGLGETREEILQTLDDLIEHGTDIVNMGQYLQPTKQHLPVKRYVSPQEFDELKEAALSRGFIHCEAAPLVRSSYHAGLDYETIRKKMHPLYRDQPTAS